MLNRRFADFHGLLMGKDCAVYCRKNNKNQSLNCSKGGADHEQLSMLFRTFAVYIKLDRMTTTSILFALVNAIGALRPAVRVKWTGDVEPTCWEPWIIVPTGGYLETGTLGPVPFREVEWVELDPARANSRGRLVECTPEDRESLIAALSIAGVGWTAVDDKLRVLGDAV